MPLPILKENATVEEMRLWTVEVSESYNTLETNLVTKTQREKELEETNQKLYIKATSTNVEEDKKEEVTPSYLDDKTFKDLSKKELQLLKDVEEEE